MKDGSFDFMVLVYIRYFVKPSFISVMCTVGSDVEESVVDTLRSFGCEIFPVPEGSYYCNCRISVVSICCCTHSFWLMCN